MDQSETETAQTLACPDCDSSEIRRLTGKQDDDAGWRCLDCGAVFTVATRRESKTGTKITSGLARELDEAEPGDLVTDGGRSESGTDRVPAGKCPNHGKVSGDEVNFRFPTRAECADCGSDLETAGLVERQLVTDGGQHEAAVAQDDDGLLGFFDSDGKWGTVAELQKEFDEHADSDVRESLESLADAGIVNTRRDDDGEIVTVQLSKFAVDLIEAEGDVEAALVYAYHGEEPPEDKRKRYSELVKERGFDG